MLAKCAYCGDDTRLFENTIPICIVCSDLPHAERLKRKKTAGTVKTANAAEPANQQG